MSKVAQLALFAMVGLMSRSQVEQPTQIRSYKIEKKKEVQQLSRRKIQRMKGKKTRKNRGKNRRSRDTGLYASLRR